MKKDNKIYIFTYNYPIGVAEKTFIEFEIKKLSKKFSNIHLIPISNLLKKKITFKNKSIRLNLILFKKLNIINFIINFVSFTIFSLYFYKEINKILFSKNFFFKLKLL